MDYQEAVDYLKKSLIFQMSLGSKELFHSNVWWWLIENDKNFIKAFIPDFNLNDYCDGNKVFPKREEKNRDILIWLEKNSGEKAHIVIENKIKTLPTLEQIEKYTVNLGPSLFQQGVLTGIGQCTLDLSNLDASIDTNGKWSYVSYDQISSSIIAIAKKSDSHAIQSHLEQIKEYCETIKALNAILEENIRKCQFIFTYGNLKILEELRISDVFKKHKGSQFLNYVKSRKAEIEPFTPNGYQLIISQSFHNGKTTLDIRYSSKTSIEKPYRLLGVQIEGDQFRIVAEKNARLEKSTPGELFYEYENCWFDNSYDINTNRTIHNRKTRMKPRNNKKYDSYNTKDYCFVYQYFDIDKFDTSFDSLFRVIVDYLKKASYILSKN